MREHRAKLSTLFLIVLIDLVGFAMVIPVLPLYAEIYRPSPVVFGLLMASYSLMQFLFAPVLGRLSDPVGRRPILIVSLAGACVGYLMLGLAGSLSMLFVSRVIAGISGANISNAQAVIADITGPETRAKGMGITDPHGWTIPPWLRRFLTATAAIMVVIVLGDLWYLHRLKTDPTGRFVGQDPHEIIQTWYKDEVNPPE